MRNKFEGNLNNSLDKEAMRLHFYSHVKPTDSLLFMPGGHHDELNVIVWRGINPAKTCMVDYEAEVLKRTYSKESLPQDLHAFINARAVYGPVSGVAELWSERNRWHCAAALLDLMGTVNSKQRDEIFKFVASDCLGPTYGHYSRSQTYTLGIVLLCARDGLSGDRQRDAALDLIIHDALDTRSERTGVKWYYKLLSYLPYATKSPMKLWVYGLGTNDRLVAKRER